jgi:hypothetical protein
MTLLDGSPSTGETDQLKTPQRLDNPGYAGRRVLPDASEIKFSKPMHACI